MRRIGPDVRQQLGVRVAVGQIADALWHRDVQPRPADRRPFGHDDAAAGSRDDDTAPTQLGVGGGDRRRADAELPGQHPDRRQPRPRRERLGGYRLVGAFDDIPHCTAGYRAFRILLYVFLF